MNEHIAIPQSYAPSLTFSVSVQAGTNLRQSILEGLKRTKQPPCRYGVNVLVSHVSI